MNEGMNEGMNDWTNINIVYYSGSSLCFYSPTQTSLQVCKSVPS